jgi:hypothetical protein
MKKHLSLLLMFALMAVTESLLSQGTAFTYQGQLQNNGSPASGNYDFTFALFNNNGTNTGQVGNVLTNSDVGVTNGLFTVALDFGPVFTGSATWLAISVRTNGSTNFTALNPLHALTPAPYAIFAESANAAGLAGTISNSNIANGSITSNLLAVGAVGSNQIASGIGLWSQSGPNVYYSNGFAGIGTASPATPLNVASSNNALNTFLSGSSSVGTWLTLGNTGGGAQWTFISTGSGNGEGASNLVIHPGSTLGLVNSSIGLQLQPDGKVGINTRNLTSTLTVNGTVAATNFSGSGSGLGGIPAATGLSGTIPQSNLGGTGTYVPTIGNGTGSFLTKTQLGYYALTGDLVYFEAWIQWTNKNSVTGNPVVISLPNIPTASSRAVFNIGWVTGITNATQMTAFAPTGYTNFNLLSLSASGAGATGISVDNCAPTGEIQVTGQYRWR